MEAPAHIIFEYFLVTLKNYGKLFLVMAKPKAAAQILEAACREW